MWTILSPSEPEFYSREFDLFTWAQVCHRSNNAIPRSSENGFIFHLVQWSFWPQTFWLEAQTFQRLTACFFAQLLKSKVRLLHIGKYHSAPRCEKSMSFKPCQFISLNKPESVISHRSQRSFNDFYLTDAPPATNSNYGCQICPIIQQPPPPQVT